MSRACSQVLVSDDDLIKRIAGRDAAAMRTLYLRYRAKAFDFIDRHVHDGREVEDIVSQTCLDVWHAADTAVPAARFSPHVCLRQHRLKQAMTMLCETDDLVVSIAAALDYPSQTAFAAAFRKLTGETPSDFAEAHALAAIAL
ncbi:MULTISPECIES: helix-turn-helix domain-containing protein [unclassified Sinorhizobium]|uniref:helix-turn-helix domain-containing protein n=1 Tax=unclassified Sinorhizobium TaxID=2613772 RepID=UPI0035250BB1